ncbi:metallophosphoesterase family protein [Vibrio parahaemolyticus]|uniref:metallophosphoesterase family protein n=1 Tax=Vibrio parahaemolyticus TaxID=670 RepID=UPI0038920961
MNRREFIKLSALGLSTYGVMGNLVGCHGGSSDSKKVAPFLIPNDIGTTTKFAVIGDVHANGNLLKSTLEEIERQGIKNVLLVGDQTDTPNPSGYISGYSEVEAYMNMIKEEQFDQRLNLYPVRGNHEGTSVMFTGMENSDFDDIKAFWTRGVGSLLDDKTGITKPTFIREDTGEYLDCCGLYSFVIDETLFFGCDPFITANWDGDVLTTLSDGTLIKKDDDWLLNLDFIESELQRLQSQFNHVVLFCHYPLSGRNHTGQLEEIGNLAISSSGNGLFPNLEAQHPGITQRFLSLLTKYNVLYVAGHDHIISKSLIYAEGACSDVDEHVHFGDYAQPENNLFGASATQLFPQNKIHQYIFGSCSHKHYAIERHYLDKYEIPLMTQATNASRGRITAFGVFELKGDLHHLTIWGNEHLWYLSDELVGSWSFDETDGFREQYKLEQSTPVEQHFLDESGWKPVCRTLSIKGNQSVVIPSNYAYNMDIPASNMSGMRGTSATIIEGINEHFNCQIDSESGTTYAFAEEIKCLWLQSTHPKVLSDVLMIDGMLEQTGTLTDELGNILNPGEGGQWYNESIRAKDTFTLAFDIDGIDTTQELTLARYYEEEDVWLPLVTHIKGSSIVAESLHQNGFFAVTSKGKYFR